jgi:hypothetical protein
MRQDGTANEAGISRAWCEVASVQPSSATMRLSSRRAFELFRKVLGIDLTGVFHQHSKFVTEASSILTRDTSRSIATKSSATIRS